MARMSSHSRIRRLQNLGLVDGNGELTDYGEQVAEMRFEGDDVPEEDFRDPGTEPVEYGEAGG